MREAIGAVLLLLAMAAVSPSAALAGDLVKQSCDRLSFRVGKAADVKQVECFTARQSDAPSDGPQGATADYDVMVADSGSHVFRVDAGKAEPNTYFHKNHIETMLSYFTELEEFERVGDEPEFDDFELVRFQARLWKKAVDCIGFLQYGDPSIGQTGARGAKSFMVGYDCWRNRTPNRSDIEGLLTSIR
jgi:hypothetical protein